MTQPSKQLSRRSIIKNSAAIGTGLLITNAQTALTATKNSALEVGLIGCGGRGNHDASNFRKFANCRITALSDPFDDRLDTTKQRFQSHSPKTFQGLYSYKELLQTNVDAVIITSPPYFHPEHFSAAVESKKHVYLEKPVSTDTAGAKQVLEAGKQGNGTLTMMVGFQSRFKPDLAEAVQRVHEGAIGEIVCGDAFYHSGDLQPKSKPGMDKKEVYLRNWLFDQVLSGDILVEQNIHIVDVCNWLLQAHPIKAIATGGQKVRNKWGDTWDHFEVIYTYPNDVKIVFSSTQFLDLGWGDAGERLNGSLGAYDGRAKPIQIRGKNPWDSKKEPSTIFPSEDGEENKVKTMVQSIMDGKYINEISSGVDSTLSSILGRTAAYRKKEVTWDEMIQENEKLAAQFGI
jgi:myo-inositol 2-dehydrogenase/D-chiro-inositol 1-dehydrogenase